DVSISGRTGDDAARQHDLDRVGGRIGDDLSFSDVEALGDDSSFEAWGGKCALIHLAAVEHKVERDLCGARVLGADDARGVDQFHGSSPGRWLARAFWDTAVAQRNAPWSQISI